MATVTNKPGIIQKTANSLCKLIGHHWRYKDYSNWMSQSGGEYPFKASRNCTRCSQHEYLYKEWEIQNEKSPYDVEIDSLSVKQLPHLQVH